MTIYIPTKATNSQSDGINKLQRIEFEALGKKYKFSINPEQFTQFETGRVTVTQTKGGSWVDDFGAGLPTIEIKGTTGFKNSTGVATNGFKRFKELRELVRGYYNKIPPGTIITPDKEMIFHNHTDGESWVVVPKVFSLMRSVSRSILYLYEIQLICLRPANIPSSSTSTQLVTVIPKVSYPTDSLHEIEKKSVRDRAVGHGVSVPMYENVETQTALEKRIIGHGVSIPIE